MSLPVTRSFTVTRSGDRFATKNVYDQYGDHEVGMYLCVSELTKFFDIPDGTKTLIATFTSTKPKAASVHLKQLMPAARDTLPSRLTSTRREAGPYVDVNHQGISIWVAMCLRNTVRAFGANGCYLSLRIPAVQIKTR